MKISSINNQYNRPKFGTQLDKTLKPIIEKGIRENLIGINEMRDFQKIANDGLDGHIWCEFHQTTTSGIAVKNFPVLKFESPKLNQLKELNGIYAGAFYNHTDEITSLICTGLNITSPEKTESKEAFSHYKDFDVKKFISIMKPKKIKEVNEAVDSVLKAAQKKDLEDAEVSQILQNLFDKN